MSREEEAGVREKMVTALLAALDEELTGLAADVTRVRDSVRVVSTLWRLEPAPETGLAGAVAGQPEGGEAGG